MEIITSETNKKMFGLEQAMGALFRHKRAAAGALLGVFALAAAASMALPKRYESSMKLLVKSDREDLLVSPEAHPAASVRSEVTESQINSEIELLTSYELLNEVVKKCRLAGNKKGTRASRTMSLAEEEATSQLQKRIKIAPARKADIIEVTYSADSPRQAAYVLRELANAYLEMHLRVHRSVGTQEFFRKQTERYGTDLRAYETRLNEFRRVNNLVSINQQKDLLVQGLLASETALRAADTAWREAVNQTDGLADQLHAQRPRIVTQNKTAPNQYSMERLNTMLAELQNKRSQTTMKFRADDRVVLEIDEEIANTRAALDNANKLVSTEQVSDVNPIYAGIEHDLAQQQLLRDALRVRCQSLAAAAAKDRSRLAQLEGNTAEYDALDRGLKESEENYLLYSRKQEEARIADSLDQQKVANVSLAEAPVEHFLPTRPNTALNLLIGALLGLLISMATVLCLERTGGGFTTPAQIESETGIPVLATVSFKAA